MDAILVSFEYWAKGGWLLIPIAMVCVFIWYYVLKLNRQLDALAPLSQEKEAELENQLTQVAEWKAVVKQLEKEDSAFHDLVIYIIQKIRQGIDLFEVFHEVRIKTFHPWERDLLILAALVTSAPLLGLLGTVFGMIGTFQAIAERSCETTELMASGISQGLITTQFGLIIAIPGIFGVMLLKKKKQQLEVRLSGLQNHFVLGMRRRK
ncbi:MotA/TolQ/ExbB proton channel family protein [bacterium]|nr:MotA/TolQ/ExbB proton channel family protein [bacterium]